MACARSPACGVCARVAEQQRDGGMRVCLPFEKEVVLAANLYVVFVMAASARGGHF